MSTQETIEKIYKEYLVPISKDSILWEVSKREKRLKKIAKEIMELCLTKKK